MLFACWMILGIFCRLLIFLRFQNIRLSCNLDPGQNRHCDGSEHGLNDLQRLSANGKSRSLIAEKACDIWRKQTHLRELVIKPLSSCADPDSSVRGWGHNIFFKPFFLGEGKEDLNTTKSGPSSAHQRNAILMAFR